MTFLPASAKRHLKLPVSRYLLAKWKQCVLMLPCWHWLCRKCYINIWHKCNLSWWHGFCPGHTEDTFRGCALRRLNLKFSTFTLLRFSFTTLAAQWKHGEDANRKNRISKKKCSLDCDWIQRQRDDEWGAHFLYCLPGVFRVLCLNALTGLILPHKSLSQRTKKAYLSAVIKFN